MTQPRNRHKTTPPADSVHDLTAHDTTRANMQKRIAELKAEFEAGQKMLTELATKRNELEATMLRISGAIQVLEEMLAQDAPKE